MAELYQPRGHTSTWGTGRRQQRQRSGVPRQPDAPTGPTVSEKRPRAHLAVSLLAAAALHQPRLRGQTPPGTPLQTTHLTRQTSSPLARMNGARDATVSNDSATAARPASAPASWSRSASLFTAASAAPVVAPGCATGAPLRMSGRGRPRPARQTPRRARHLAVTALVDDADEGLHRGPRQARCPDARHPRPAWCCPRARVPRQRPSRPRWPAARAGVHPRVASSVCRGRIAQNASRHVSSILRRASASSKVRTRAPLGPQRHIGEAARHVIPGRAGARSRKRPGGQRDGSREGRRPRRTAQTRCHGTPPRRRRRELRRSAIASTCGAGTVSVGLAPGAVGAGGMEAQQRRTSTGADSTGADPDAPQARSGDRATGSARRQAQCTRRRGGGTRRARGSGAAGSGAGRRGLGKSGSTGASRRPRRRSTGGGAVRGTGPTARRRGRATRTVPGRRGEAAHGGDNPETGAGCSRVTCGRGGPAARVSAGTRRCTAKSRPGGGGAVGRRGGSGTPSARGNRPARPPPPAKPRCVDEHPGRPHMNVEGRPPRAAPRSRCVVRPRHHHHGAVSVRAIREHAVAHQTRAARGQPPRSTGVVGRSPRPAAIRGRRTPCSERSRFLARPRIHGRLQRGQSARGFHRFRVRQVGRASAWRPTIPSRGGACVASCTHPLPGVRHYLLRARRRATAP